MNRKLPSLLLAVLCAGCSLQPARPGTPEAAASSDFDPGASVGEIAQDMNRRFPAGSGVDGLRSFVGEHGGGCLDFAILADGVEQPVLHCFIAEPAPPRCGKVTLGIAPMLDENSVKREPRTEAGEQVCDATKTFCASDPQHVKALADHATIQRVLVYRIHEACAKAAG